MSLSMSPKFVKDVLLQMINPRNILSARHYLKSYTINTTI